MTNPVTGPWFVVGPTVCKEFNGRMLAIATCEDWDLQTQANARLLAAAPDLLKALRGVMGLLDLVETAALGEKEFELCLDQVQPKIKAAREAVGRAVGSEE